jgi:MFS family permease
MMGLTSLLYGATTTAVSTLQQKEFNTKQRATLGSLSSLFGSFAFGIVAIGLGAIGDHVGPRNAMLVAQVAILSILIFYKQFFSEKHT